MKLIFELIKTGDDVYELWVHDEKLTINRTLKDVHTELVPEKIRALMDEYFMSNYRYLDDDGQHAHTLDGQPLFGCSTVIKEVMPPFLAKWGAQCAVDFLKEVGVATEHPASQWYVTEKQFTDAILAWTKVREKAADKGTGMHELLEQYVKKMIEDRDGKPALMNDAATTEEQRAWAIVQRFAEWSMENVEAFIFSEAHTYSRDTWTGGIVDCVARLKTGELAVIDFKSSKEGYFNQYVQAAGYALMLDESGVRDADGKEYAMVGKIEALIVIPFGAKKIDPYKVTNVEGFKQAFRQIVELYKLSSAFNKRDK